jgi:hypothetical protein
VFAARLDPELLKAFKAAQRSRRCEVRGLRRSPRLRGSTTQRQPGGGRGELVVALLFYLTRGSQFGGKYLQDRQAEI